MSKTKYFVTVTNNVRPQNKVQKAICESMLSKWQQQLTDAPDDVLTELREVASTAIGQNPTCKLVKISTSYGWGSGNMSINVSVAHLVHSEFLTISFQEVRGEKMSS